MKTFTEGECTAWLDARGIRDNPYGRPSDALLAEQFRAPQHYQAGASLLRVLLEELEANGEEVLLQIVDWSLYAQDMMAVVDAFRAGSGESRRLIDSPGHLFSPEEGELLIGFFSLTFQFQWSAYLYVGQLATFYNWEGDLIDVWTTAPRRMDIVRAVFQAHGLSSTFNQAAGT